MRNIEFPPPGTPITGVAGSSGGTKRRETGTNDFLMLSGGCQGGVLTKKGSSYKAQGTSHNTSDNLVSCDLCLVTCALPGAIPPRVPPARPGRSSACGLRRPPSV